MSRLPTVLAAAPHIPGIYYMLLGAVLMLFAVLRIIRTPEERFRKCQRCALLLGCALFAGYTLIVWGVSPW